MDNQQGTPNYNDPNQPNYNPNNNPNNQYGSPHQYNQNNPYYGNQPFGGMNAQLPNATAVLVLGICSIVFLCAYGFGLVLGIVGLVLANKDKQLYRENPGIYTNYGNLHAGWIMSLISVILGSIIVLIIIVALIIGLSFASFR